MTIAIITNITFAILLASINIMISVKIFRELASKINQKGGGNLLGTLTYVFLTKFVLLSIAIITSGASPFLIFCLVALNIAEFTFVTKNNKNKKLVKQ